MGKQPTFQELLAAYNKLLKENENLHKEVDRPFPVSLLIEN